MSGITAALVLLGFILFAAPLIEMIPLAALVGVMFVVVIATFEWASFRIVRGVNREDAFVLFLVTGVTVIADLAIAVIVGVIVSALVFAWKHARHIGAKTHIDNDGWKVYELDGPLFFGSISHFKDLFDVANDPQDVVIDFNKSRVWDSSGVDALDTLADKYEQQGKKLHIRHISSDCRALLKKANKFVEINVVEDPRYKVASDQLG